MSMAFYDDRWAFLKGIVFYTGDRERLTMQFLKNSNEVPTMSAKLK